MQHIPRNVHLNYFPPYIQVLTHHQHPLNLSILLSILIASVAGVWPTSFAVMLIIPHFLTNMNRETGGRREPVPSLDQRVHGRRCTKKGSDLSQMATPSTIRKLTRRR